MERHDIVLVAGGNSIAIGLLEAVGRGKLSVSFSQARKASIPESKICFHLSLKGTSFSKQSPSEMFSFFSEIDAASPPSLAGLHDLVVDEGASHKLHDLLSLVSDPSDHASVLSWALAICRDRDFFYRRKECYEAFSRRQVQDKLRLRKKAEAREEQKKADFSTGKDEIVSALKSNVPLGRPPGSAYDPVTLFLKAVVHAAEEKNVHCTLEFDRALEIIRQEISDLPSSALGAAEEILIRLGVLKKREPLSSQLFPVPVIFSDETNSHVETVLSAPEKFPFLWDEDREDCRNLLTITIDDTDTKDLDDALSIVVSSDGVLELFVHITDVSGFIVAGSVLDQEAQRRWTSIYSPDLYIPMLPKMLSGGFLSLEAGSDRRAVTHKIRIGEDGQILSTKIYPSWINVDHRLDYEEASSAHPNNTVLDACLRSLIEAASRRVAFREARGAFHGSDYDRKVHVSEDGEVTLSLRDTNNFGHMIVHEAMVAANQEAAAYCFSHQIPSLYLGQAEPVEKGLWTKTLEESRWLQCQRLRTLRKSVFSLSPSLHYTLGVETYTQCTSPLRRYQDLIVQRQIMSSLSKGRAPLYSREDIEKFIGTVTTQSMLSSQFERHSRNYWLYCYLKDHEGEEHEGLVLWESGAGFIVELVITGLRVWVPKDPNARPGARVQVIGKRIVPRLVRGYFRIVGDQSPQSV